MPWENYTLELENCTNRPVHRRGNEERVDSQAGDNAKPDSDTEVPKIEMK